MKENALTHKSVTPAGIEPWIQAARPAAYPMILLPLLLGQALAFAAFGKFNWLLLFGTAVFGALVQTLLLYLNDYADEAIDRTNRRYWLSGGSRVLPEGKLRSGDLLKGAQRVLALLAVFSLLFAVSADRPWILAGTASSALLCWAYNLKPLQLSYRGHGEILQGLGCGVLLPLIGFYVQLGTLHTFPWLTLVPLYLIFHAGNIVTALPDFPSDKSGGKRTCPVRLGEFSARVLAFMLLVLAHAGVALSLTASHPVILAIIGIPSGIILISLVASGTLRYANAFNFDLCKRFVTWMSVSQAWLLSSWILAVLVDSVLWT